ncbi:MAG: VOC family protein [Patescibacteria group bacterium]|nr:VOC family protein [Patescibacteria group bacterium]
MNTISPFFWFDHEAEEAAKFYVETFKKVFGASKAKLGSVMRYDENSASASGQPDGSAMTVSFRLLDTDFTALNGGKPENFDTHFTGAVSFVVDCKNQKQIDGLWDAFAADGGSPSQCGWIQDKFGITWQVVPSDLTKYIGGRNKAGAARAMQAMLSMTKFDIATLKEAYEGK